MENYKKNIHHLNVATKWMWYTYIKRYVLCSIEGKQKRKCKYRIERQQIPIKLWQIQFWLIRFNSNKSTIISTKKTLNLNQRFEVHTPLNTVPNLIHTPVILIIAQLDQTCLSTKNCVNYFCDKIIYILFALDFIWQDSCIGHKSVSSLCFIHSFSFVCVNEYLIL